MTRADDLAEFCRERDEALRSLDGAKILAYCQKYGAAIPQDTESVAFWAGVHRARLSLQDFTEEEKSVSRQWLSAHGYEARGLRSS